MKILETILDVKNVSKSFETIHPETIEKKSWLKLFQVIFLNKKKITKKRRISVLKNINLTLSKGESLGILGLNGSGKSTLLQIIAGTLSATKGRVKCDGKVAAILELGSGFNPDFTGRENIYLCASIYGLSNTKIKELIPQIESFADIDDFIDQPVRTYSTGMTMRLAFSIIAYIDAQTLIIDEALAVGDIIFVNKCIRFLKEFKKKGSLILVSHDIDAVRSLCDRCIWMDKGSIRLEGEAKYVCDKYLEHMHMHDVGKLENRFEGNNSIETSYDFKSKKRKDHEYGSGKAEIHELDLYMDDTQTRLSRVKGGERVCLSIKTRILAKIPNPIFGFILRNRTGNEILAFNTESSIDSHSVIKGESLTCLLKFILPILCNGHYTISAAISEKTNAGYHVHHWLHDGITISYSNSTNCLGLVGVKMYDIEITKYDS